MPTQSTTMELPIKFTAFSGPAINALDQRKETNDHKKVTAGELRDSFVRVKTRVFAGLAELAR